MRTFHSTCHCPVSGEQSRVRIGWPSLQRAKAEAGGAESEEEVTGKRREKGQEWEGEDHTGPGGQSHGQHG